MMTAVTIPLLDSKVRGTKPPGIETRIKSFLGLILPKVSGTERYPGEAFKVGRYNASGGIVERMKVRIGTDERLGKRVDQVISTIQMSQEQT